MKVKEVGESISAETYRALRSSILSGKFAPGTKIGTPQLCKAFGASLGAVREALSRLHAEGLVTAEAHRGYSVAPISIDDLRDLTQTRIDVESICLARSMERGDSLWEAELIASAHLLTRAFEELGSGPYFPNANLAKLHRDYHRALVSACDSPRLLRLREQLFDETERYRRMNVTVAPNRKPNKEHRQITAATLARDLQRAQALLAEHLSRTSEAIIKAMTAKRSVTKSHGRARLARRPAASP